MHRNIALSVKNIHQKCIVCLRYTIVEKSLTSRRFFFFFFTRRLVKMSFLFFFLNKREIKGIVFLYAWNIDTSVLTTKNNFMSILLYINTTFSYFLIHRSIWRVDVKCLRGITFLDHLKNLLVFYNRSMHTIN